MSLARARRYERAGFLAIDPKAFLELFIAPDVAPENTEINGVTVVDIRGPLDARAGSWCDSYESIRGRVASACESGTTGVVLRIDSPGGDAQGCFECAREIRDLCAAAGKPLIAYVDGRACSAAYALATAASRIVLSESATVGSIGVLSMRTDYSAMNASRGVRVAFITSGAHKTDGHPDAPITESELAAEQLTVNSLAGVFFGLVAEHRGIAPKAIEQLEARVLHGAQAIAAGLADEVAPWGSTLARVAAGQMETIKMAASYEKTRAALEEMAAGDDANARAAKAALAALDAAGGGGDDDGDEAPADDDADKDKSGEAPAGDDDDEKSATDPAPTPAASAPTDPALQALAEVHKLRAEIHARDERDERNRLIASRDDFGPEMVAALRKAPIATVREMVASLPKGAPVARVSKRAAADTPARAPLHGNPDAAAVPALPPAEKAELDRRMGLIGTQAGVVNTPFKLQLGGPVAAAPNK